MSGYQRIFMLAAALTLLPAVAFAQPLPAQPTPVPFQPPAPPPGPPPLPPQAPLQQPGSPPPPMLPVVPPAPSSGLADPGPNGWGPYGPSSPMSAFFIGLDLDLLKPVFKDHLQGTVNLPDGTSDTLHVPRTELGWTVSPRLEVGYKLPDSFGEFLIGYRFLNADGTGTIGSDTFGPLDTKSRLSMNIVDLDYQCARYSPGPRWEMQWTLGARIAGVFYDDQIGNDFLYEHATNNFFGAGVHGSFELERKFNVLPSFGFFAKADGSTVLGEIKQHFTEENYDASGNLQGAITDMSKTQSVETVSIQAGLSYTPIDTLRFTLGYEYEHWFSLGRLDNSNGELTTQGVFLRGRLDF